MSASGGLLNVCMWHLSDATAQPSECLLVTTTDIFAHLGADDIRRRVRQREIWEMEYLDTAFAQLAFAWKLCAYAEDGKIDLDQLDQALTFEEGRMIFVLPDKIFDSYGDLILACQNNLSVAFGAAAITLNRSREESGIKLPNPIETEREQFVSLAYQIRNAFAHDIAEPRWNMNQERYFRMYEFGGVRVDLNGIENQQPFRYEDIGGPDVLFAMKDYFTGIVT